MGFVCVKCFKFPLPVQNASFPPCCVPGELTWTRSVLDCPGQGLAWASSPSPGGRKTNCCPKTPGTPPPTPHDVCTAQQVLDSSKCDVLHLFCYINLPLQIKDLKQDFLFKFPKKTNTAVFSLLWSSNNPIFYCLKKMHTHWTHLTRDFIHIDSERTVYLQHVPVKLFWSIHRKIITIQVPTGELSAIRKKHSRCSQSVYRCICSTLLTFYYLDVSMA